MVLIDADILCYRIGYAAQKDENNSAAYLLDVLHSYVCTIIALSSDFEDYRLYLTGRTN